MGLVIGIDTGGTYTDGVILDIEKKMILKKAKARTTRDDLTIGIEKCIERLTFDQKKVKGVALSTTLATNAIVENKGGEVGLILIGYKPTEKLPTPHYTIIPGGHDTEGNEKTPLNEENIIQAIKTMAPNVDAFAISSYLSVRNPEHELRVAQLVKEHSNLPVVCGHHLSSSLGFQERTVTAVLNGRLIPIIKELIDSIKFVLHKNNIDAPIMIVKGDGSLMNETVAIEKPVETILSGPAASIAGTIFLTNNEDAIVFDMGGTTTDIAILENGSPKLKPEGATVGGWLTRVLAADIHTFGIGGDSYLHLMPKDKKISIGPRKVWPLSYGTERFPHLKEALTTVIDENRKSLFNQHTDCFVFLKEPDKSLELTDDDKNLLNILKEKPLNIYSLGQQLGKDPSFMSFEKLENAGVIARIGLTPTDILHVLGIFEQWDKEGAEMGVQILANLINITVDEMAEMLLKEIIEKLSMTILSTLIKLEGYEELPPSSGQNNLFTDKVFGRKGKLFDWDLKVKIPLVGIGAPVKAYLQDVAKILNCQLIIPENAEVANAVGAAAGKVMETIRCLIIPGDQTRYIVHLPWERKVFYSLESACDYGLEEALKKVKENAEKAGACDIDITHKREDIYSDTANDLKEHFHIETMITVTAVGNPKLPDS